MAGYFIKKRGMFSLTVVGKPQLYSSRAVPGDGPEEAESVYGKSGNLYTHAYARF